MKTCPTCRALATADDSKFCPQCGQPLDASALPVEPTVRWTGSPFLSRQTQRREIPLDVLFAAKPRVVIGRSPDCDVCLPHPSVSRYHALLERLPEGFRLRDLNSVNGVSLDGRRLIEPILVRERQHVGIGPFLFSMAGGVIYTLDSSRSLRLEARRLEKVVRLADGSMRKLLDDINLAVEPGEFVSLLGPSGSGKSTLMDCLNGRRRATAGSVLANGEDFYQHFDSFRQSLGYVPQRDIVHTQLTVARALYYTAQLRLPTDTEPAELSARLDEVLEQMELVPHRDTLVANLSGGQIKRVSLGAELLARPCLLYIDEATSGLDAGTEARMMRLFRSLADQGKSILCITHNVDNVDRCHLALVLARGKLVYFGPPSEAAAYFGVGRLGEIYDRLAEKDLEAWEKQYATSSLHQEFVARRLAGTSSDLALMATQQRPEVPSVSSISLPSAAPASLRRPAQVAASLRRGLLESQLAHQFRVLTARYSELMWGDRRSLRLLLLQAPIVAAFIVLGFAREPYQDERTQTPVVSRLTPGQRKVLQSLLSFNGNELPALASLSAEERRAVEELRLRLSVANIDFDPAKERKRLQNLLDLDELGKPVLLTDQTFTDPRFTYMLLYMLTITVLWFGCNNAAKEIVKEEAIYGRERAVNLGIVPYLASKFLVLSVVSAVQVLLLMLLIYGSLWLVQGGDNMPPAQYMLAYLPQYGVLVLLVMTGVALGLLLSACVATPDRANALLPYVLIPQIILGGGIMTITEGPLHWLAVTLSPVYWAFRGVRRGATTLPEFVAFRMHYNDSTELASGMLAVEILGLLLLTAWFLRRKDVGQA